MAMEVKEKYGVYISLAMLLLAIIAQWVAINGRITALEVQLKNDETLMEMQREQQKEMNAQYDDMDKKLDEINMGVHHLNDVKMDKYGKEKDAPLFR